MTNDSDSRKSDSEGRFGSSRGDRLAAMVNEPGGAVRSLGLRSGKLYSGAVAGALPAVAIAFLWGAGPVGTALVGVTAWGAIVFLVRRVLGHLSVEIVAPIVQAIEVADGLRRGRPGQRFASDGAPLVRELAGSLSAAAVAVDQRSRVSQANLMSVEAAFDRIHSVLQSLGEGVILVDQDLRVVLANSCSRRYMKDGGKPIEGRELTELLSPEMCDRLRAGLTSVQQNDSEQVKVTDVESGDRIFDVGIVRAQSPRLGAGVGIVVALVDVTRNHEINRLKDQLLSSISHELRTPLTNICASTEILEQVTPSNEGDWQEFLGIVNTESVRLRGLVDDMLASTQLHSGELQWRIEPVAMGELARSVIDTFAETASARRIKVGLTLAGEEHYARGDRERLREVMTKLLDNALKFCPEGGTVAVDVFEVENAVEVDVSDSGPGIDLENRETVFEIFRQIGDHLTDKPAGTGLGLPLCRGFVDGMGGSMWADESEMGGAAIRFVLPLAVEHARPRAVS